MVCGKLFFAQKGVLRNFEAVVDNLDISILLIGHQMSCVVARTLKIQVYF